MSSENSFIPFLEVLIHSLETEDNRKLYIKVLTNNKKYRTSARYDKNWKQFFIMSLPKNKKLNIEIWQEQNLTNSKITAFALNCHEIITGIKNFLDEEIETGYGTFKIQIIPILSLKRMMKVVNKEIIEAIQSKEFELQEPEYSYYPARSSLDTNQAAQQIEESDYYYANKFHTVTEGVDYKYSFNENVELTMNSESLHEVASSDAFDYMESEKVLQNDLDDIYDNLNDDQEEIQPYYKPQKEEEEEEEEDDDSNWTFLKGTYIPGESKDFTPQKNGLFYIRNKKLDDLDVYIYPIIHEDYEWAMNPVHYRPIVDLKGAYWYKNQSQYTIA